VHQVRAICLRTHGLVTEGVLPKIASAAATVLAVAMTVTAAATAITGRPSSFLIMGGILILVKLAFTPP
jgi:hypothetical protein